jgi:hypothetical protein
MIPRLVTAWADVVNWFAPPYPRNRVMDAAADVQQAATRRSASRDRRAKFTS